MKIDIGKEFVVTQGPAYEDSFWGEFQYPKLFETSDGKFALKINCARDEWEFLGRNMALWMVSDDGMNWEQESYENLKNKIGTLLPNGDRIYFPDVPAIVLRAGEFKNAINAFFRIPTDSIKKEDDGSFPYPVYSFKDSGEADMHIYDFDTLPDEYSDKEWKMLRIKKDDNEARTENVCADIPNRSANAIVYRHMTRDGMFVMRRPQPYGSVKVDKEGNVWVVTHTGHHLNPYTKGVDRCSAVMIFKSEDNGQSFKMQSYIPYRPNPDKCFTAYYAGGFSDADMEFMDDGSIIVIMRTACIEFSGPEWNPMYISRSTDGGKTFSEPEEISDLGVSPKVCKFDNGLKIMSYGRPGIYLKTSTDPGGMEWSEPIEIMTGNDRSSLMNIPTEKPDFHQWAGSCCYTDLKKIDEKHALLVYSDFFYPDITYGTKKRLKTILSRIITIED